MPLTLCLIGKFFPIQGGVSKDNQWLAYILAKAGIHVHVVTNAEEVEPHYRCLEWTAFPPLPADCQGSITIHTTQKEERRHYIPYANPFVTKLAAMATEVIRTHQCQLIYSYYLEPYAVAASLASSWTGVPFGIRHAGSDIGSLFQSAELQTAYREVLLSADYIVATPATYRGFLHLGISQEKLTFPAGSYLPPHMFTPDTPPLDVNAVLAWMHDHLPADPYYEVFRRFAQKTFQPQVPTIGIYGKIGEVKGSFDLVKALACLQRQGIAFQFLTLAQGSASALKRFAETIEEVGIATHTWLLPFLPHWTVPQFIRACTAVCFLERDFPIPIHTPLIPQEIFACGTCQVLSHEIAEKQPYYHHLHHGANVFLVDPHHQDELAATLRTIIQHPHSSQQIGLQGFQDVGRTHQQMTMAAEQGWQRFFPQIYEDIQQRRMRMSLAEMQSHLAHLYTNDAFRHLFAIAPDVSFAHYLLTEQEKQALRAIDRRLLDYFATSLKMKQQGYFRSIYPATFLLEETLIQRLFNRFYQYYPAHPQEDFFPRMLAFGTFMEQSLALDESAPPYASEIAKYERLHYRYTYQTTSDDAFTSINLNPSFATVPIQLNSIPTLLSGVFQETFVYPIISLMDALKNQQALEEIAIQSGHYDLVFQREPHSLTLKVFTFNRETSFLLNLCQEHHPVAAIIEKTEQYLQATDLTDDILEILFTLQEQHIIGVSNDSPSEA
ncbi:glycosyltransferase [Tengunoibacter tsumagoiensis]|uniref:Glycosyl transferase family 1 domain-containing protein n=1 Tax=Tengunoibacter tsumagoiensis TaxID=2014871 RepID=A0A402A7W0_9CHLR|nr:glycosyltransferase [Tengunoibacter tsumagoiensis]GCE15095.1 hypothetical protein KTT_49540 [Tengunoibacter tsumagoiensis]